MSDLNKKNINYGALNRFYQDLKSHDLSDLNDKIDNIQTKPIENVESLPDADANKDSVFRLEGDEQVYISKYNSNNAPDSEQVGVAYVSGDEKGSEYNKVYYSGTEVTIIASNGTFTGYAWELSNEYGNMAEHVSTIPASQIVDTNALFYNAPNDGELFFVSGNTYNLAYGSASGNLAPIGTVRMGFIWDLADGYYIKPIGYEWKPVVTEDELYQNESTFTGATLTVDGSQPSIVASGSTTIVWDDLASSIPSGKSVEVSVVLINTGNSALTPTMSGNYQMMGDGNLTIQAGELGLYRGRYISALDKWLVEAIYQEVS